MARHELLNNITHKNLRVITRHSAELGSNVSSVQTFPTEYADIMREYPIFFRRDAVSGEYTSIALLGFEKGENLFLDERGWNASYVPGIVAREPFFIGFQDQEVGGETRRQPVIHVDMESPRVSTTEGELAFLPHGGNSPYIDRIAKILDGITTGMAVSAAMFAAFTSMELIEPLSVEIKLNEEMGYKLTGLHTISGDKLRTLNGESLAKLNQAGFLQGAYLVLSSLRNMPRLIELKRRKVLSQAAIAS
jgi:hypothetical protein